MIYYAITPKFSTVTRHLKEGDLDAVYNQIMQITNGNHEESANASGWCEIASISEIYDGSIFTIEIIED